MLGYGFRTPFQSAREHGGVENVKQEWERRRLQPWPCAQPLHNLIDAYICTYTSL